MPPKEVADQLVEANVTLADAFQAAGLPVVWVHATGLPPGRVERPIPEDDELPEWFADLDGRLPAREGDLHIDKPRTISAFSRTDLAEKLRAEGVTQVVFTGIAMGAGVEASARSAFDEGFTVTVVSDASSTVTPNVSVPRSTTTSPRSVASRPLPRWWRTSRSADHASELTRTTKGEVEPFGASISPVRVFDRPRQKPCESTSPRAPATPH